MSGQAERRKRRRAAQHIFLFLPWGKKDGKDWRKMAVKANISLVKEIHKYKYKKVKMLMLNTFSLKQCQETVYGLSIRSVALYGPKKSSVCLFRSWLRFKGSSFELNSSRHLRNKDLIVCLIRMHRNYYFFGT